MARRTLLEAKSLKEFREIASAKKVSFADLTSEEGQHLNELFGAAATIPKDQDIPYTGEDEIKIRP